MGRTPIIDITDLYHPPQDPGDNFDLIMPYALPEIDLRAVILDATDEFRQPIANPDRPEHWDHAGPRDPGIIPVAQLNYIFGRDVPYGVGPFRRMRAPDDPMLDVPPFQQRGIELILETLRASKEPVEILSFGSARTLAAAYNRDPALLRARTRRVHLSAGATSPRFPEWNILLDPQAIVCLLRSDLPIAIYPCGTEDGACGRDRHNSFWELPDLRFVARMHSMLRRYLGFAIGRAVRMDFLRALEHDLPDEEMERTYSRRHNVWETAVWLQVANRRLVRRADGSHAIVPEGEVSPGDAVLPNELVPCSVEVPDDGFYRLGPGDGGANRQLYDRGDPFENERALQEALPALYCSFAP
jgi:hypothetical protein